MTLQPTAVFNAAEAYGITGFMLLGLLSCSIFALTLTILHKNTDYYERLLIASMVLFACVQWLPSISDAFFWWNGAIYYTGSFSLQLLIWTAVIRFNPRLRFSRAKIAAIGVAMLVFGGTNYVSAFLNLLINIVVLAVLFVPSVSACTAPQRKYAQAIFAACALIGLLFSILAPGNAIRQSAYEQLPFIQTIVVSLHHALLDIARFSTVPLYLACLALVPLFVRITKRMAFQFPFAPIVLIASFFIFAAQNAPVYYGMGASVVPMGRVDNINYFSFVLLLNANAFYLTGWVMHRLDALSKKPSRALMRRAAIICLAIFSAASLFSIRKTTSFKCLKEYRNGTVQAYAEIYDRQFDILTDPSVRAGIIPENPIHPSLFNHFSNSTSPTEWYNVAAALFFEKDYVAQYTGSSPADFTPPVYEAVQVLLRIGSKDYTVDGYHLPEQAAPVISIESLAAALTDSSHAFAVDASGTTTLELELTASATDGPLEHISRPLDAVYNYELTLSDGRRYIRQGFAFGGRAYFSLKQLSQILNLSITIASE